MRQASLLVFLLLFGLPSIVAVEKDQCAELFSDSDPSKCDGTVLDFKRSENTSVLILDGINQTTANAIFFEGTDIVSTRTSLSLKNTTVLSLQFNVKLARKIEIEIQDNELLEEISVALISVERGAEAGANVTIDVRRNKKLTRDSLDKLKKLYWGPGSYIQDAGECGFQNASLPILDNLDGCVYVNGDLVIDKKTNLTQPDISKLSEIRGCLKIKNSKELTDLWFLENISSTNCTTGENEIVGNKNLCLNSEQIFYLNSGLGNVTISGNNECNNTCTPEWLLARNDAIACHTINGNLTITGIPAGTKLSDLKHLSNVEVINGRLSIHHNNISEITFFPKLHTVNYNITMYAAIHVIDNKYMTAFNFSSLTAINLPGAQAPLMTVEHNNMTYFVPDEDQERYRKMGKMRFSPEKPKPTRRPKPRTSFNTSRSEDDEDNEGDLDENSMSSRSKWKLALQIIGGLIGSGVAIILLLVIVFLVRKRLARKKFIAKRKKVEKEVKICRTSVATSTELDPITCRETLSTSSNNSASTDPSNEDDDALKVKQLRRYVTYGSFKGRKGLRIADFMKNLFNTTGQKLNTQYTKLHAKDNKILKIIKDRIDFSEAQLKPPENMTSKRTFVTKRSHDLYSLNIEGLELNEITIDKFDDVDDFIRKHMSTSGKIKYTFGVLESAIAYCLKHDGFSKKQLVKIDGPCHFVGDIHGSWHDLQAILSLDPEGIYDSLNIHPMLYYKYVFCGDYVDRGYLDIQTIIFLAVFAKRWKNRIVMLRGNHEDDMHRAIHKDERKQDNLLDHLVREYGEEQGKELQFSFFKLFAHLPFAALINGKIFACHGGIGQRHFQFRTLEEAYDTIPMPLKTKDVHHNKLATDTFWSDPFPCSWAQNHRGSGVFYGDEMVDKFCDKFGVDMIVRGHENIGFAVHFNGKCVSIFGCFDTELAMRGLPRAVDSKQFMDAIYQKLPKALSIAVLRVNADGTLHLMMIRHKYLNRDMDAAK